jgi:iron complex outermembrane recepter protein
MKGTVQVSNWDRFSQQGGGVGRSSCVCGAPLFFVLILDMVALPDAFGLAFAKDSAVVPLVAVADTPSTRQRKSVADMDLGELGDLRISPFDVSTKFDDGYRASNSVTGSRFDSPIRELPFAIQAFTRTFIRDRKPVNIIDVARYSPGVTYRSNDFNEGNANLTIRGFTVSSLSGGNIQILRDGFHGPSIFDFTNISRVEVVKGPASFLYGQVAPGGIVNIITKNPQPEFAASAETRIGSYGEYRTEVDVTGPVVNSVLLRLAASYDQDMHYWSPYDAHSWDLSPSLLWQPAQQVRLSLKFERFHKGEHPQLMQKPGYGTQSGVLPTPLDPNMSAVDVAGLPDTWNGMSFFDYRNSDTYTMSVWCDYRIDDHWNVRLGFSHMDCAIDALFTGNYGLANNTTRLQGRRVRQQMYENRDNTGEVQGIAKYDLGAIDLRLLVGAQYAGRRFENQAGQAPNDPALGSNPTASPFPLWDLSDPSTWDRLTWMSISALTVNPTDQTVEYADRSLFGGVTVGFLENRLLALAGARYTSTESQVTNHVTGTVLPKSEVRKVTPQYGMLFKWTQALTFFASYAESFVPGAYTIMNLDGSTRVPDPTTGLGYDVGVKAESPGGHFSATVTFFDLHNHNIVSDLASTMSTGSVVIYNIETGEQRSRGLEVDATITPVDEWQIYLSYSYMKARIAEFSGEDDAILAQDPSTLDAAGQANYKNVRRFHDAPLQMSAPHLANLWTRYNFGGAALLGVHVAGGASIVRDQTLLSDTPESAHQNYALIDVTVGYEWNLHGTDMVLDCMVKNLTNEHYRPSQSTRARPREFIVSLLVRV